jgi:hypothetical protein
MTRRTPPNFSRRRSGRSKQIARPATNVSLCLILFLNGCRPRANAGWANPAIKATKGANTFTTGASFIEIEIKDSVSDMPSDSEECLLDIVAICSGLRRSVGPISSSVDALSDPPLERNASSSPPTIRQGNHGIYAGFHTAWVQVGRGPRGRWLMSASDSRSARSGCAGRLGGHREVKNGGFVAIGVAGALGLLNRSSFDDHTRDKRGFVQPGRGESGLSPRHFWQSSDRKVLRFVQSRGGTWQVIPRCRPF